jgi:pyruvate formate lyase activating enzyme
MLVFRGIQKTTLVDYPGQVACTLFLGGCQWRCRYCHNPALALNHDTGVSIPADEALAFLDERQGFLDGVCVTGGEPLLHVRELLPFLQQVKSLGFQVKLDTNGALPDALCACLDADVLDYIAMDIKAPLEQYAAITQVPVIEDDLRTSIALIKHSGLDHEFRTTVHAGLTVDDVDRIGQTIAGCRHYYLQPVRTDIPLLDATFAEAQQAPTASHVERIAHRLAPYVTHVHLRS